MLVALPLLSLLGCRGYFPPSSPPADSGDDSGAPVDTGVDSDSAGGDTADSESDDTGSPDTGTDTGSDTGTGPEEPERGPGGCPGWFPVDHAGASWRYQLDTLSPETATALGEGDWRGQRGWIVETVSDDGQIDELEIFICDADGLRQVGFDETTLSGFAARFDPPVLVLPAALEGGLRWSDNASMIIGPDASGNGAPMAFVLEGRVGARTTVTVPAGTFEAYPVTTNAFLNQDVTEAFAAGVGWVERSGVAELESYTVP